MSATKTMNVGLSPEVLEAIPDIAVEFILAKVAPYENGAQASAGASRVGEAVRERHGSVTNLASHPLEDCYREFYRSMGLKAAQVTNPVKQARRALEHGYRSVSRPVDTAMEIEYATLVSFQLYDASPLPDELMYRIARGDEPITTSRGDSKVCKRGELILAGAGRVVHSSYYGNEREFMLAANSACVLVRILRVPGIPDEPFAQAATAAKQQFDWRAACRVQAGSPKGALSPDSA